MIRVEHLFITDKKTILLQDISFTLAEYGFVSFCADQLTSSYMALLLGAQIAPQQGEIWFQNHLLTKQYQVKALLRSSYVQGLYSDFQLIAHKSVWENITLNLKVKRPDVDHLLQEWDLYAYRNELIEDLDFIRQAKTMILRCRVKGCRMMVYDVASSPFSKAERQQLYQLFSICSKDILIVVCGDIDSTYYADHIIECKDGCIISDSLSKQGDEHQSDVRPFILPATKEKQLRKQIKHEQRWKQRILYLCLLISAIAINIIMFNGRLNLVDLEERVLTSANQSAIEIEKQAIGDDGSIYQNYYDYMQVQDLISLEKVFPEQLVYSYQAEDPESGMMWLSGQTNDLARYDILEMDQIEQMGFQEIIGRYPATFFEVCLSDTEANRLINLGYFENLNDENTAQDCLGENLIWYGRMLTITGILPYAKNPNLSIQIQKINDEGSMISQLVEERLFVKKGFMRNHDLSRQMVFPNVNKRITYQNRDIELGQIQSPDGEWYFNENQAFLVANDLTYNEGYLDFFAVYQLGYKDRYQEVLENKNMTLADKFADFYHYASTFINKEMYIQAYRINEQQHNSTVMNHTFTVKGILAVSADIFNEFSLDMHYEQGKVVLPLDVLTPYLKTNQKVTNVYFQNNQPSQMRKALNYLNEHDYYHAFVSNSRNFQVFVVDINQLRDVLLFIGILFFTLYVIGFLYLLKRSMLMHRKEMTILFLFGEYRCHLKRIYLKTMGFQLLKYNVTAVIASMLSIYFLVFFIYYEFSDNVQIPLLSYLMIPVYFMMIAWCVLMMMIFMFLQVYSSIDVYLNHQQSLLSYKERGTGI